MTTTNQTAREVHTQLFRKLTPGTVSHREHRNGMLYGDPVQKAMEAVFDYAANHQKRYGTTLSDDYFLGPAWLDMARGARALLNGEGMFDGGTLEELFWKALEAAGFTEEDL